MERTTVAVTGIVAVALAVVILGIALMMNRASLADTAKDREQGTACINAGNSWVRGYSGYQCIVSK